jgi:hypothetical protein
VLHTRDGKYLTRLGGGLRGLTQAEIDAIRREAGTELTALPAAGVIADLVSAAAMEELRRLMTEAPHPTSPSSLTSICSAHSAC